ncbi:MAG: hypothetical protein GXY76_21830 [Chloroflexi bacterium]|nr:hypothetical protein [Chloroflexota bacterium]
MAKKKSRKSVQQRRPVNTRSAAPAVAAAPEPAQPANLAEEYHYVITDLKRIGLLAAAMFALLVVLALVFG